MRRRPLAELVYDDGWGEVPTWARDPDGTRFTIRLAFSANRADDVQTAQVLQRNWQAVGIKEVHDDIWLVSFMGYDLGYFDLETRVLEPLENPFGPKVSPM